jgi:hypothetical protein
MQIEYNLMAQGQVLQDFNDCRARNSFIMGPLGSGKNCPMYSKIIRSYERASPVKDKHHKNYGVRLSRIIAARNNLFRTVLYHD